MNGAGRGCCVLGFKVKLHRQPAPVWLSGAREGVSLRFTISKIGCAYNCCVAAAAAAAVVVVAVATTTY